MAKATPDPNRSRVITIPVSGIQIASLLRFVREGIGRDSRSKEAAALAPLIPELEKVVDAMKDLEIHGCGLDHPVWKGDA